MAYFPRSKTFKLFCQKMGFWFKTVTQLIYFSFIFLCIFISENELQEEDSFLSVDQVQQQETRNAQGTIKALRLHQDNFPGHHIQCSHQKYQQYPTYQAFRISWHHLLHMLYAIRNRESKQTGPDWFEPVWARI